MCFVLKRNKWFFLNKIVAKVSEAASVHSFKDIFIILQNFKLYIEIFLTTCLDVPTASLLLQQLHPQLIDKLSALLSTYSYLHLIVNFDTRT